MMYVIKTNCYSKVPFYMARMEAYSKYPTFDALAS